MKPFACDWDGDGKPDLLVGTSTHRILWIEKYDLETDMLRRICQLRADGSHNPFASRKGPAVVVSFDRGKPDLSAVDSHPRVCLFRQGTGARRLLELEPRAPLLYRHGEPITTASIGPSPFKSPNICIAVCDWMGTAACDLMLSSSEQASVLENRGTTRKARFERPKSRKEPDGTVMAMSHHESHVVGFDWDDDGRLDLMIGGEAGTMYLFQRDWLCGLEQKVSLGGVTA